MRHLLLVFFAIVSASLWSADAKPKPPDFLEPEEAGPEYLVQGEYEGEGADGKKLGAQVIAIGDANFYAVIMPGGLPGAGSDGKTKWGLPGKTEGAKTVFTSPEVPDKNWANTTGAKPAVGYTGEIVSGTFSGKGPEGAFTLKKVMRQSPTFGAKPPTGAVVLFDGTNVDKWNGKMDSRGYLQYGARSKDAFTDFTLHMEFRLPFKPHGRGQDRGNSGIYLQNRYECQVLDSFGLAGKNNECGGIYTIAEPKINMAFPPLTWQTYDIDFTAAKFDAAGAKTANAKVTVKHNGVLIHENLDLPKPTGGGEKEAPTPGIFQLQDHGNRTFYKNIWIVEKK